jgi:hypothetical protein
LIPTASIAKIPEPNSYRKPILDAAFGALSNVEKSD